MRSPRSLFTNIAAVMALAVAPLGPVVAAPTFSFSSPSGSLHPAGSNFSVQLVGSGLSDLYSYEFSVVFDPKFFHVLDVTEGPFLATGGSTIFDGGTIDNTGGEVGFAFDTLISAVSGVSGGGVLANIDLAALTFGTSSLSLTDVLALDSALNEIAVTASPIALAVPEPETMALLLVGAGACLVFRKRAARAPRRMQHGVVAVA